MKEVALQDPITYSYCESHLLYRHPIMIVVASPFDFKRNRSVNLIRVLCLLLILSLGLSSLHAQEVGNNSLDHEISRSLSEIPHVYLDCPPCDYNHVRREITFVNYVRDPALADVHVFVTGEGTSGGTEYEFSFIGRNAFSGTQYTLTHYIDRSATSEETREVLQGVLERGFASFVLQTPLATRFSLEYEEAGEGQTALGAVDDPWDHWVFEVYAGSIELELESKLNEFDSRWGFYADRVTDDWKFRLRPYFNYDQVEIQQSDGEGSIISRRHRHGFNSYAIMSLGDHWSAGLFGTYLTENERNIKHEVRLNPGVEYSLFPYSEATRKSVTFTYQLGYAYADYYEKTIFGQTEQNLLNHQLQGSISILKPWGSVETGLVGSHYFHDIAHRRIEFYGQISVRLTEGLSLNFQADYDVIQDQLSLPARGATLEEVLLQQRELATDFSLSGSIAISYTFGSEFSNIVNTRF